MMRGCNMRVLTSEELACVSGGKADQTWTEWLASLGEAIMNARCG